ncbi:hypothetical protein RSOLAG22IIIB_13605 [Rhizoctonia solani]|uniref:GST N-terminal domain-containing protein n=1 Tax=Rhizoctonia solani TaxID=456999 RepID=A0A0K6FPS8_9AGAM|nr:hypothetical protein RSOLAG22IIIB_13605 [Rhizoctonia solani]
MVTVKLYGMPYSAYTQSVWTTAQEIGIDIELVPVDLAEAAHRDPEYIENYHPFGVIPVLVVGPLRLHYSTSPGLNHALSIG